MLESRIDQDGVTTEEIVATTNRIIKHWEQDLRDLDSILFLNRQRDYVRVKQSKIEQLREYGESKGDQELCQHVKGLTLYPLHEIFRKYESYVYQITDASHKSVEVTYGAQCPEFSTASTHVVGSS